MTTFSWSVENYAVFPSVDNLTNVIARVGWRVAAERDGHVRYRMGVTELPAANASTFIVWDDVTDAVALAWVQAELASQPGLITIEGDQSNYLTYLLSNLETELDTIPPPTVTLPPRSAGDDE